MSTTSTNWKLILSYNGSRFHGWQVQPGFTTIQGVLSEAIERLTGERVLPQGSGRTDAGVHAFAQVATFELNAPVPAANLQRALNRILPDSIRVLAADHVPASFHARHSARSKTYEYRIFERRIRPRPGEPAIERICSPFLSPFVWDCRWPLDLAPMQEAAALLIGTRDFTSMAATNPDRATRDAEDDSSDGSPRPVKVNPVKTIFSSEWSRTLLHTGTLAAGMSAAGTMASEPLTSAFSPSPADTLLVYRITGSGFLHHMVRNIVGTLVDIGRGSLNVTDLRRILDARDRTAAGPTAPARGLYLVEVHYDEPQQPGWPIHNDGSIVGMSGTSDANEARP